MATGPDVDDAQSKHFFLSFFSLFLCFLFKSTHVGSSTKYIYFNIVSDAAYIKPQV